MNLCLTGPRLYFALAPKYFVSLNSAQVGNRTITRDSKHIINHHLAQSRSKSVKWSTFGRYFPRQVQHSQMRAYTAAHNEMDLVDLVRKLHHLAPLALAEDWDNVGLLVEPSAPHKVTDVLLTIDLTEEVLAEALEKKVNFILAYHPPIFVPLKKLTQSSVKERIIVKCIENRIAVYSPHTCVDAMEGGVNDWLVEAFGKTERSDPISPSLAPSWPTVGSYRVDTRVPANVIHEFVTRVQNTPEVEITDSAGLNSSGPDLRLQLNCGEKSLSNLIELLHKYHAYKEFTEVIALVKPPMPGFGMGRISKLSSPVTLDDAVTRVKQHLNLERVNLAIGAGCSLKSDIKTVAVCAGSGSGILQDIKADLYFTGELTHHQVLDAQSKGRSVILCGHTNTERGYLTHLKEKMDIMVEGKVNVLLSQTDTDPCPFV
ncbi:NIF3-like protein 1 isoform X2 [Lingula anatina]|uniref:NIF3-like protein 1 n=1 Tax=Lingula anatina TaxID=7574 RepID=A0A1S3HGI6_LINAN|nr:NIF3-like protein 1 isoform X2 [Lingula anatina]|eukprot:XP_013385198.1 NIF3-like protein 1 isoform X2 [Lingula anatina]